MDPRVLGACDGRSMWQSRARPPPERAAFVVPVATPDPGRAGVSRGLSSTLEAVLVVSGDDVARALHNYFARALTSLDRGLSPIELTAVTW